MGDFVLKLPLLHAHADALNHGVGLVAPRVVVALEVHAKESAERLPKSRSEGAHERFHDGVGILVGLAIDELNHHFALIFGELFHHRLVLGIEVMLKVLEVGVFLFFGIKSPQVLVGFLEGAVD